MTRQALSNLRVIDLTHYIAGPYCTKLLAGWGAEVIKVERPGKGDKMRSLGPFFRNEEGPEQSVPFLWLNTGKKSITLDLKAQKGVEILKRLVQRADVVVENFSPRVMPSLGLDYETLRAINPHLVMASISNFGQSGPYRNYRAEEIEAYAMSGSMYLTGDPEKPPLAAGPAICQYSAGLHAYFAILLALFQRASTNQGQYVDVAIMECGLEHIELTMANFLHLGKNAKRGKHPFVPWDLYSCLDGYAPVICAPFRHWLKGAEIFQEPRLFEEKYQHITGRMQHRQEVESLVTPWLSSQKKKDVFQTGQEHNLGFGYLASFDEVLASPQHQAREFFEEIDHPVVGRHKYCGAPFKMSLTPWQSSRAPLLGEQSQIIYGEELGYSPEEVERLKQEGIV